MVPSQPRATGHDDDTLQFLGSLEPSIFWRRMFSTFPRCHAQEKRHDAGSVYGVSGTPSTYGSIHLAAWQTPAPIHVSHIMNVFVSPVALDFQASLRVILVVLVMTVLLIARMNGDFSLPGVSCVGADADSYPVVNFVRPYRRTKQAREPIAVSMRPYPCHFP